MKPGLQHRTLAQQLSGAFVVFGAIVVGAFLVTALMYGAGRAWLTPESERAELALTTESSAHAAMLDQQNALRGYLLTREPSALGRYARARTALEEANRVLMSCISSVPALTLAMVSTQVSEERWRLRWADAAAETRRGAPGPSMLDDETLFEAYRQQQASFAAGLEQHSKSLGHRERQVVAARVALELSVFIAILLLAMRQHRALHEAIVTPVAALLGHIRGIRDGRLEARADRAGPRELAELAEGLNEMVSALVVARELTVVRDEALRDHSGRLRSILEASREFSESLNLRYVVGAVRRSTAAVGGYERVIVWLMDDEQKRLINSDETIVEGEPTSVVPWSEPPPESGQDLAGRASKAGRITFEGPKGEVSFSDRAAGSVRAIAIPLIVGARVVGVLEARHCAAQAPTPEVIEILEMLATHAATAIESARLHEVIEQRSQVDVLTRLLNRRRLDEDLDAECKRCARYGRPLAFVMLDIDHFKAFNDTHGHPQADTALQGVADLIRGCVRATDTAYRYGGEEFCILLRETSAADAMLFAERVRQRIQTRFESGVAAGITASFGVAEFTPDAPGPRALLEAADAAMYESKHAGRNRVALSVRPGFASVRPGRASVRPGLAAV